MRYDKNFIIDVLERLDRAAGGGVMHVIVVRRDDPLFDLGSLGQCPDCGVPGLPHGQIADWRVAGRGDTGLHGHVYSDRVEFHLDLKNACKYPVQHALADTAVLPGAVIGGVVTAALVALLGGKEKDIATGFGVGATGGGLIGLGIPSRTARKIAFRDLLPSSTSGITYGGHHGWST